MVDRGVAEYLYCLLENMERWLAKSRIHFIVFYVNSDRQVHCDAEACAPILAISSGKCCVLNLINALIKILSFHSNFTANAYAPQFCFWGPLIYDAVTFAEGNVAI